MRRILLLLMLSALSATTARAQSTPRKAGPASPPPAAAPKPTTKDELYQTVARLDTEMFAAFNAHDVNKLMAYFADNVEFYHDKGGLSNFAQTKEGFARLFAQSPDITRTLVAGTLEVYPVKNYGAMHIATQRFCHLENGRQDCGNSKFVMVWQQQAGTWRITRVVSYDH
ncbi:nuclear transport factor 2 family protein [Hymenobacter sp. DH14]|uniref:Nuclear transport factor 2 family protein n=1 Tax=Hymenobacter cyanobacteriorum TaxID=2926463 RepID=A0A9X1VDL1_9BACT|nr:nuclear transport factor 2 family protein [Hymenobacter cyanobacteriorum]MCI1186762.1 nuclear transport factor 2 family protein [Hymenobacter cyanobacteriorum]